LSKSASGVECGARLEGGGVVDRMTICWSVARSSFELGCRRGTQSDLDYGYFSHLEDLWRELKSPTL
jgi:hypothetical protein